MCRQCHCNVTQKRETMLSPVANMCEPCKQRGHMPTKWHMMTGLGQSIKWFTVNNLKPELRNWASVSTWGSSTSEQGPTLENVSETIRMRRFLYVSLSKQLVHVSQLCVRGLLLDWISWGFAMGLSVDNMRPNLDMLLTIALFAAFSPLGTFSLLAYHVHIQKTLRSCDLQPGHGQQNTSATAGGRETNTVATTFSPSLPI